ncbi:hypothetical protein F53441_2648 [Fusarium austroafricanum]|uniref:NmrA-like domain-containing protein n=1 Tax=Fusarium austroafricanum TaxID=2364996 RepID=A0A8H4KSF0_9HYPO|nr:hypothetical protein F53441_2648 [Fusarium austroafricanum]
MTRNFLIVGATGQQGKATINAILKTLANSTQRQDIKILALTRSISSPKSQALQSEYPEITLIQGDIQAPQPIFEQHPSTSSVFIVTVPPNDEAQAIPLIEAATASTQVDHIVFSSVDRGGDVVSWTQPTEVPHFAAKHRIELRLRELCEANKKRWTILRPTGFMDSYNPGFFGQMMASLWAEGMPKDRKMQLISTHDIGVFAAKALLNPDTWSGKATALAGDELSFLELQKAFREVVGEELPQTYKAVAYPILWMVKDASKSFEWFRTEGWKADINTNKPVNMQFTAFALATLFIIPLSYAHPLAKTKECGCPRKCPKEDKVKCLKGDKRCKVAGTCSFFVICDNIAIPCGADTTLHICVPKDFDCTSI